MLMSVSMEVSNVVQISIINLTPYSVIHKERHIDVILVFKNIINKT